MGLKRLLMCVAAAALAACGGSGGDGDGPAIDGGVVKGPVSGATVCVYRLIAGAKGEQIPVTAATGAAGSVSGGCYVTPADGSYSFRLPRGTSGDLLVEATGGTFCSNEEVLTAAGACPAGGTPVALGTSVMTSVVGVQSNAGATVYTTPLTTAAVNNSRARGMTAAGFATEFTTLAGQILGPTNAATPSQRPTRSNQRFLLDVADFLKNGGSLANAATSLAQGTTTFTASPGGTPGGTTPGTPPAGTTPATVASALVGTYDLVFKVGGGAGCGGTGCSFTDGQTVTVVVHGDNRLELPGGKILANPYYRSFGTSGPNLHEVIWFDADAKLEYALSDNQGQFNEINVGDMNQVQPAGFGKFLGQLKKPEPAGNAALAALAGSYTNAGQYRGEHPRAMWTTVQIAADGAITFSGGGTNNPSITAANVTNVNACVNQCGTIRISHNLDLDSNSQTAHDFVLHLNPQGGVRAISWDPTGDNTPDDVVGVLLIAQGGPALTALQHSGAALPTTNTISGMVGTATLSFDAMPTTVPPLANAITLDGMGGDTGPSWRINLFPGADIAAGTYGCRKTNTLEVSVQATLAAGGFPVSTLNAGRCTIEVVTVEKNVQGRITLITGRFVAEMFDGGRSNGPARTVSNGVFRWQQPN